MPLIIVLLSDMDPDLADEIVAAHELADTVKKFFSGSDYKVSTVAHALIQLTEDCLTQMADEIPYDEARAMFMTGVDQWHTYLKDVSDNAEMASQTAPTTETPQ